LRSAPGVRVAAIVAVLAVVIGGCASDDDSPDASPPRSEARAETTASSPTDTTPVDTMPVDTVPVETVPIDTPSGGADGDSPASTSGDPAQLSAEELLTKLASDELGGRENQTEQSVAAQDVLIGQLSHFAEPAIGGAPGDGGFRQPFELGTNIVGVIPGGDLADEWVVIGDHYDHLGPYCPTSDQTDHICNGATDNASGVALVMESARMVAAAGTARRSVLVAFWDAEEDGLRGSAAYTRDPIVPLESTVAYLNYDIQGFALFPSVAEVTAAVGAETGGPPLVEAAHQAASTSPLDMLFLSARFGQGRSDYASFLRVGVPAMQFIDGTGPCYHTAQDEVDVVDFDKLEAQIENSHVLLLDLASRDDAPVFDADVPEIAFSDAQVLLAWFSAAEADLESLSAAGQDIIGQPLTELREIVSAGPEAFDDEAIAAIVRGSEQFALATTLGECTASS
jgi:hypothetical protein